MCAQVFKVKTLRTKGLLSPEISGEIESALSVMVTLAGDHRGNLNDGVNICLGKNSFTASALNIEAHNS